MNEMQTFSNIELGTVRTVLINGEPYFVGSDVTDILGYKNSRKTLADHVDEEDKDVTNCDTLGGVQQVTVINESGLYTLAITSKKPEAKKFRRWITSEVLPSIRKHGAYATPVTIDKIIEDPEFGIKLLTELTNERNKRKELETTIAVQTQQLNEYEPKATYYDEVLNCEDLLQTTIIAKDYGWSAVRLNTYLHDKGVQYKQGDTWLLYQKYADKGYTKTKTHTYKDNAGVTRTKVHTYWTQAGRLFIYELMKNDGNLPKIEKEEV